VLYDQAMAGIMDPVVVAMSSAFVAFPTGLAGPPPRRKVDYGTGIVLDTLGHIVTDRAVTEDCYSLTLAGYGGADRIADDKTTDLALLRVYGAQGLQPMTFATEAPKGADAILIGIAEPQAQDGGATAASRSVRIAATEGATRTLEPPPSFGFNGAAAVDAQGRLIGLAQVRTISNAQPPAVSTQAQFVPVATVKAFLDAQKVAPAGAGRTGMDAAKASVVRVICTRK
jgi:hypothetical protein